MIRTLICLLFLSFTAPAWATSETEIAREFSKFYDSHEIDPRFCGRNVDGFLSLLRARGQLPVDMRRLVIRAPHSLWHPASMLIATGSRSDSVTFWSFHVVVLWKGKVYDFSFDREPRILPINQYLEAMFVPRKPFAVFGEDFRIGGKGPLYGPQDAREEIARFTFTVERPLSDGSQQENHFKTYSEFARWLSLPGQIRSLLRTSAPPLHH